MVQLTIHHAPPKGTRPDRLVLRFPPSAERGRPPADGPPPLSLRRGETVLAALPPGRSSTITFSGRAPKGAILVVSPACTLIRDPSEPITLTDLASGGEGPPLATAARIGRRPRQEVICIRPEVLFESLTVDGKPPPAIAAGRIGLLLADHVHRLAFWHPAFDPAYRRLPTLIAALRQKSRHLTALGVTAPVAGQVDRELRDRLQPHRNWAPPAPAEGATGSSPQLPPIEALRVEGADAKERLCAGLADRLRRVLESGRPAVVWSRWEPTSAPLLQPSTGPGPVQPIILTHEAAPTPRKPVRPLIAPDFRPRYTPPHAALSRPVEPFGPAGHAGGVASAPTGGLWISSEARAPDLPPPPAWVIQTALSGGIDDWRDRTWPRPAGGAAALHLADLPDPACESDRTDRGTLTPACVDGPCPFGRPTLCDDGIGHREIEAAVPSPSSICREGVRVLKGLLTTSGAQAGTRQALFYLSVLGVIDHWDRPDPTGEAIRVHGFNPSVKPDRMVAGVETFFRETDITAATRPGRFASPGAAAREIERTWDRVGPAVAPLLEGETGSTRRTIEGILPPLAALAAHRRENLRMMRQQALTNLKAFLTGETCRHLTLRRRTGAVPPDWRCGVCDRCTEAGGKTSALSPQPSALSHNTISISILTSLHPSVLSPQSSALSPQPSVLIPQSSVLSPQPSVLSPQPSAPLCGDPLRPRSGGDDRSATG